MRSFSKIARPVSRLFVIAMLMATMTTTPAYATSLDELMSGSQTTVAETQVQETQPQVQEQVQPTQAEVKETVRETLGQVNNDFANQLANVSNLSTVTAETSAFSKQVNAVCTVIFQYISGMIAAAYLITVAVDMAFILIPPLQPILANGYMGNPTPDTAPGMNGNAGVGATGAGLGMGGYGGYGGYGGRGMMNSMGAMAQQAGMATAQQNQPALGRHKFVSNAALNAVATESSSKKSALVDYMKNVMVTATLSVAILILSASGIFARIGAFIAMKIIDIVNGTISNAV